MAPQSIGVGLIGCGTVGRGIVQLLTEQAATYAQRAGAPIELRSVLVRDTAKARDAASLDPSLFTNDPDAFFATDDMSIVIEVAGGTGAIADHVRRALKAGKHVVTANKSLLAAEGPGLFALARRHNACIAFEASCGGGIPAVTALTFGLMSNRIDALYGILNGTCNYILTQMAHHGQTYQDALADAQAKGFAEADPTLDVSGRDAAEKLAVLASLAFGVQAHPDQVACTGIDNLDLADIRFGAELGYEIKLLTIAERSSTDTQVISLRTHPCFVHADLPIAQVRGSFNAVSLYGHAVGHSMLLGRGAGGLPTAGAVVSDLLNVAAGWYPAAFAKMKLWPDQSPPAAVLPPDQSTSRYYLRISAKDQAGVIARIADILGRAGISISSVLQHEVAADSFVPVVITTHSATQGAINTALAEIEKLDVINTKPVCIHITDMPEG